LLHQVGDLFELNVKLRCQKVNEEGLNTERSSKVKRDVLGPVRYYFEIIERRKDESLSRGYWICALKQKCNICTSAMTSGHTSAEQLSGARAKPSTSLALPPPLSTSSFDPDNPHSLL
jgi:hypothetical protein